MGLAYELPSGTYQSKFVLPRPGLGPSGLVDDLAAVVPDP